MAVDKCETAALQKNRGLVIAITNGGNKSCVRPENELRVCQAPQTVAVADSWSSA